MGNCDSLNMPDYLTNKFTQYNTLTAPRVDKGRRIFVDMKYGVSHESPSYFKN